MSAETPAGWYPDPQPDDPSLLRWWDGQRWTENTHPGAAPGGAAPSAPAAPTAPDAPLTLALAPEEPAPSSPSAPLALGSSPRVAPPETGLGLAASGPPGYQGGAPGGPAGAGGPSTWQPSAHTPGAGAAWQPTTAQAAAYTSAPGEWTAEDQRAAAAAAAQRAQMPGAMTPEEYAAAGSQILAQGPASVGLVVPSAPEGSGGAGTPAPGVVFGAKPIGPAPSGGGGRRLIGVLAGVLLLGAGGFAALQLTGGKEAPAPAPSVAAPVDPRAEALARARMNLVEASDVLGYREAPPGGAERSALEAAASLDQCVPGGQPILGGVGRTLESPSGKTRVQHAVEIAPDQALGGFEQQPQYGECLRREAMIALDEAGVLGAGELVAAPLPIAAKRYGSLGVTRADRLVANTPGGGKFYLDQIVLRGPGMRSSLRITGEEPLEAAALERLLTGVGTPAS